MSEELKLLHEASELLEKVRCDCNWGQLSGTAISRDEGHEPTCSIVKVKDWRYRAAGFLTSSKRPDKTVRAPKNEYVTEGYDLLRKKSRHEC